VCRELYRDLVAVHKKKGNLCLSGQRPQPLHATRQMQQTKRHWMRFRAIRHNLGARLRRSKRQAWYSECHSAHSVALSAPRMQHIPCDMQHIPCDARSTCHATHIACAMQHATMQHTEAGLHSTASTLSAWREGVALAGGGVEIGTVALHVRCPEMYGRPALHGIEHSRVSPSKKVAIARLPSLDGHQSASLFARCAHVELVPLHIVNPSLSPAGCRPPCGRFR
jgi:hypothetical protein